MFQLLSNYDPDQSTRMELTVYTVFTLEKRDQSGFEDTSLHRFHFGKTRRIPAGDDLFKEKFTPFSLWGNEARPAGNDLATIYFHPLGEKNPRIDISMREVLFSEILFIPDLNWKG